MYIAVQAFKWHHKVVMGRHRCKNINDRNVLYIKNSIRFTGMLMSQVPTTTERLYFNTAANRAYGKDRTVCKVDEDLSPYEKASYMAISII